jgi:hypothetical protein
MAEDLNVDGKTVRTILGKILAQRKFQPRSCHQFFLMSAVRYSLVLVPISVISWPQETSFWVDLLWVMNCDALNVIQKWNAKACSGKHKYYLEYLAILVSPSVVMTIWLFFILSFLKSEEFQHCFKQWKLPRRWQDLLLISETCTLQNCKGLKFFSIAGRFHLIQVL